MSISPLSFTSKAKHNTQVSFDINAKFQYTIKEDFMKYYNKHLEEELQGISNLAMNNEDFAEFL
ncbi:hypothetical protein OQH60_08355 [Campylobacter sp. MIT 21-1685]|uniref:hypothetical protein n=1 Tax=unclassified Campylobacter TaxID=2593542 RepID=UPI00224A52E7|nr:MULTISPECIES: hypothetical protein [unclassified Campylobacter]MCX2683865.1 hypothetical protein [Campylobacter sp. MIT 21-1684]MCX2752151.1 hypothetical protein [Campylobacter sp. MIT 21-1682]MCX2808344.1 hypothetical protein [Campylobacter sp. MIT 21-1685]